MDSESGFTAPSSVSSVDSLGPGETHEVQAMGLIATVMCACYSRGLIPRPPFADHITLNTEGCLDLDVLEQGNEELYARFDAWLRSAACPHENMTLVSASIGSWSCCCLFREALGDRGWHHFRVLQKELRIVDYGTTSSAAAKEMLEELEFFCRSEEFGRTSVLVDADSTEEIFEYVAANGGVVLVDTTGGAKLTIGVDDEGFFVRRHPGVGETEQEVFRSTEFEQIIPELYKAGDPVEYVDRTTGKACECRVAIGGREIPLTECAPKFEDGRERLLYPRRLRVVKRARSPLDYAGITEALRTVCRASVETGNPIRWS